MVFCNHHFHWKFLVLSEASLSCYPLRVPELVTFQFLSVVVQSLNCVQLFVTPWTAAHQASLSFTISLSLLKLMSIELVMPSNYLILCCPLLLLPSIFPSIRVFSNESALCIRWPKYWSFSIRPASECSGLISFRINWFDLLAVQGTLKSLLQHHSSKASILRRSAFFIVQLSHSYMTTGKTIALTIWTFVYKVMSLLFLIRCLAFLPRRKCLLILWLQSPSALILEPKKVKSDTVCTFPLSACHEVIGLDAMIFVFRMQFLLGNSFLKVLSFDSLPLFMLNSVRVSAIFWRYLFGYYQHRIDWAT